MKYIFSIIFALCMTTFAAAQAPENGLIAYYSFDLGTGSPVDETGNTTAVLLGDLDLNAPTPNYNYACGVKGSALELKSAGNDDVNSILLIGAKLQGAFQTADFTISFYMKPNDYIGTRSILSKRNECDPDTALAIRYAPNTGIITAQVSENPTKNSSIVHQLSPLRCWNLITLVRNNSKTLLYINGALALQNSTISRVQLKNDVPFTISPEECVNTGIDRFFEGFIDEFRIYDRALTEEEIGKSYDFPDMIANRDTIIYLGGAADIQITSTCATQFNWSPTTDVSDPNNSSPSIKPTAAGEYTYFVSFVDNNICKAKDSINITVIDPSTLDCKELYLPKAFSPNGDNLNDVFGISNPYVMDALVSFTIYDRWGNQVFYTDNPIERWDGSYKGNAVNPGVMLYRVRYICDGTELESSGSLTILR